MTGEFTGFRANKQMLGRPEVDFHSAVARAATTVSVRPHPGLHQPILSLGTSGCSLPLPA